MDEAITWHRPLWYFLMPRCRPAACLQVKHPDHSYSGMSDAAKCPDFVRDYDCRSDYIDPKYRVLQQKVCHCASVPVSHDVLCPPRGSHQADSSSCLWQALQLASFCCAPCAEALRAPASHGMLQRGGQQLTQEDGRIACLAARGLLAQRELGAVQRGAATGTPSCIATLH